MEYYATTSWNMPPQTLRCPTIRQIMVPPHRCVVLALLVWLVTVVRTRTVPVQAFGLAPLRPLTRSLASQRNWNPIVSSTALAAKTPTKEDTAIALYQTKYPQNLGKPRKRAFNAGVGLPVRDLDGTKLNVAKTSEMGITFSERSEQDLRATFKALSRYFGDDDALQMTQDFTLVLAMNRNNLPAIMAAYSDTFGKEPADNMVKRNPGLLFCKPKDAATADNLTMQFSYVVAVTRPAGPVLLYGLLALLLEPAFELVSGIPLRAMLLGS